MSSSHSQRGSICSACGGGPKVASDSFCKESTMACSIQILEVSNVATSKRCSVCQIMYNDNMSNLCRACTEAISQELTEDDLQSHPPSWSSRNVHTQPQKIAACEGNISPGVDEEINFVVKTPSKLIREKFLKAYQEGEVIDLVHTPTKRSYRSRST
jgi:hypothetical protein